MGATFPRLRPDELEAAAPDPVSPEVSAAAAAILDDVRTGGEAALRHHAERLKDLMPGAPLVFGPEALRASLDGLPAAARGVLERAADRVRAFAEAQRACLSGLEMAVEGAMVGHEVAPVERAGCYAPGGRFPLPSSVLMTAVTARAAGVASVWVASPRPAPVTLAAAALAGADGLLAVGGAHAIGALAYGAGPVPACDAIVGPGNAWVTAAKQRVAGRVAIDMLAGPSEVLVIADDSADPGTLAADLLAQCEHDVMARGLLVTPSETLAEAVRAEVLRQLETLPTRATAEAALARSGVVVTPDLASACEVSDQVAPEHLELQLRDPAPALARLRHYGAVFVGEGAAEVLGDYGIGPNHTLPTSRTARSTGGLSVFTFLRVRTFIRADGPVTPAVLQDAAAFARLEGLEAHARSAEIRLRKA